MRSILFFVIVVFKNSAIGWKFVSLHNLEAFIFWSTVVMLKQIFCCLQDYLKYCIWSSILCIKFFVLLLTLPNTDYALSFIQELLYPRSMLECCSQHVAGIEIHMVCHGLNTYILEQIKFGKKYIGKAYILAYKMNI